MNCGLKNLLVVALLATNLPGGIGLPGAEERLIVKSIDVRYVGSKSLSKERILSKISTKVGAPLSVHQLDDDFKKLHATGEVVNARLLSNKVPGGVALVVVVECSPLYGGVRFEGNAVFSDRKLGKSAEFSLNQPIDEGAIRKSRHEILTLYRKKGYAEAEVDYVISKSDSRGYSVVVFQIDEKTAGVLRKVSFVGNSALSSSHLKDAMEQKERGIQNLIGGGGRTDPESIARDVGLIERHYRNNGYFEARVVRVTKVQVDAKFNDLVITIDEGRGYTVSEITVNGVSAFSADQDLAPYLKTQAGKPFSASDLQDDIKMITEQYRSRGYIDARVEPRLDDPARR